MATIPDRWCITKITANGETHYRVFANFYGGYLTGDSWKISSGIVRYEDHKDSYVFHGESGSVYICAKSYEGLSSYGESVLKAIQEDFLPNKIISIKMKTYRKTHSVKGNSDATST